MPKCVIKSCPHATGRKKQNPDISLHFFPKDITRVTAWLKNAKMNEETIETLTPQILADTRCDKYRICSAHFTTDSFYLKGTRKLLKDDAIPTIFKEPDANAPPRFNPWLFRTPKRPKIEATYEPSTASHTPQAICKCNCHQNTKTMIDSSTQTDPTYFLLIPSKTPGVMQGNVRRMPMDHVYSKVPNSNNQLLQLPPNKNTPRSQLQGLNVINIQNPKECPSPRPLFVSPNVDVSGNFKTESYLKASSMAISEPQTNRDKTYSLDKFRLSEDQSSVLSFGTNMNLTMQPRLPREESIVKERKLIVFESCLDKLLFLLHCPSVNCNRRIKVIKKQLIGSLLVAFSTCEAGHQSKLWESQPRIKNFGAGNILLAASIVLSGSSYTEFKEFCDLASIQIFDTSSFRQYQDKFIFGAIDYHWIKEKTRMKDELGNKPLYLAGNIQCDTPGFSAEYCTCTLVDCTTKKIIDFEVCQVPECTSSVATEKHTFHVCLDRIVEENYNVHFVGTDDHPGIIKLMETRYDHINHQFDLLQYAKSLKEKLQLVARKTLCEELTPWIVPIITHFYWCSRTCCGSEDLFKEKWQSLLHHIINEHRWKEGNEEKGCEHGPLREDQQTNTWLDKRSPVFQVLTAFVHDPQFETDIPYLVYYCQTGFLETFQSTILKYRQKKIDYNIDSMEAQTKIAIMSHNNIVDRKQPTVTTGMKDTQSVGIQQTKLENDKVSTDHLYPIMIEMIKIVDGTITSSWLSRSDSIPQNITPKIELQCRT